MFLYNILLLSHSIISIFGHPMSEHYGYKKLTPEEDNKLANWTESSKQNIWELSGQFEGDIILSPEERNGKEYFQYRWPNNEVPYQLSDHFTDEQQDHIELSLQEISDKTCITFRATKPSDEDYVSVTANKGGCYSRVGRVGGVQQLNLQADSVGTGCLSAGVIVHEFLHALGFHHMQSDSVRDDYVTIVDENIIPGKEQNFKKYPASEITSFGEPYDYGSIMHCSAYAFSINENLETIVTKDPSAVIGQRDGLSQIDINKINKMYECP